MSSSLSWKPGFPILIVDDDAERVLATADLLEHEGYTVEGITTGNESITSLKQRDFGTVLLDVGVLDKNSLSIFHSLAQFHTHIPVIILTDDDQSEDSIELLRQGAFHVLRKPYTESHLKVIIQRAFEVKSRRRIAANTARGLIASGERYRSIVEAAGDAIILGDLEGTILSWNKAAERMFGYAAEEIVGNPLTLIMPARYRQAHQQGLERVRSTKETRVVGKTVELHGLKKGGEEFPIELSLSCSVETDETFYCGIIRDLSERKQAERALQQSEDRFQLTLDNISDAVIYGDLSGVVLWTNQQGSILLGRPSEEIVGRSLMECLSPKAAVLAESRLGRVREGKAVPSRVEFEVILPDGSLRWVDANVTDVTENKIVVGRLLVGRDITERKQGELALSDRNRILALDAEVGRVLNQNQELRALLQGCTEALVQHLDAAFARIWTLNSTEQILELQASAGLYTHLNGSHSRVPVGHLKIGKIASERKPHLTNAVIGDPRVPEQEWARREGLIAFAGYPLVRNQEIIGVMAMFSRHPLTPFTLESLGMVADRITTAIEREIAKEAHLKVARRSEQILASAGEGIYGLDLECKIIFGNPAGAKVLGYEVEELIGVSLHTSVHRPNSDDSFDGQAICPMCATLKDGIVHHVDGEMLWRKDGTRFPAEYTSTPIWDDGQLTGAVVTFRDVTERNRIAKQLLEEAKLAEVTRVLGDITHDIKNMLMPVLSGASLLEEELREHFASLPNGNPNQVETSRVFAMDAIELVINNTRRIHDRVREIADTVKGVISMPRFAPCQISQIVKGVFGSLRLYGIEKGVSLHTQELDSLPPIHADENRLFNALYNLVNNAIPETPVGGSVTVAGKVGTDNATVMISVSDTGIGMPPEIRDSLFTAEAISRKVGGTGLGTKIVMDVVNTHGGTISVESEQGKGTTFTIRLPVNIKTS
ncbi:MAG: PAS domain S-box protein [Nitrospirales bacterium]|nr:MAG: PAS domain S-box protein [Nitrospirales bacterium]